MFSLSGCGQEKQAGAAPSGPPAGPPAALIRVQPIEFRPVRPRVVAVGSVLPMRTSTVASGADGVVQTYVVDEGDFVTEGQILSELRMDTTNLEIASQRAVLEERKQKLAELEAGTRKEDIAEAEARMRVAQAVMENTRIKLRRNEDLFRANAINQDELDDVVEKASGAEQLYLAAKAARDRAVAGPRGEEIEQARASYQSQVEHVGYLEAEKLKRTTRAPFDGFVVAEHSYVGQWLSKGDPVVRLAMLNEVDIVVNVDQADLAHVRLGEPVDVHIHGSTEPYWTGPMEERPRVIQIIPRSQWEQGSRGFPVKVRLKNRFHEVDGKKLPALMEGMMAEVTFRGDEVDAILVSKDALVRTTRGIMIYVFREDAASPGTGVAERVIVQTGLSEGNLIQVFGDGLQSARLVVTEGAERLSQPTNPVRLIVEKPNASSAAPAGK